MTSNDMWHIERMGGVLKNLGLPWFHIDAFGSSISIWVMVEDEPVYKVKETWDFNNEYE